MNPGDLVVGDADGVTVVPRNVVEKVIELAEEKLSYELQRATLINDYKQARKNGTELPELAPSWVIDMLDKQS